MYGELRHRNEMPLAEDGENESAYKKLRATTIANRWNIRGDPLGSGGFGMVYLVKDKNVGELSAVKAELKEKATDNLIFEFRLYQWLHSQQFQAIGIPRAHYVGETASHHVLVMDLCGPSLERLKRICPLKCMSLKSVTMLALQALKRIEHVHRCSFVHRDIKPENLVMGRRDRSTLYLLDFGLAKKFRDHTTKQHLPYFNNKGMAGTPRYASVRTHMGIEQSRRDDLESLGYVLVYLWKGKLPWMGFREKMETGEKYQKIFQLKKNCSATDLCEGMPMVYVDFIRYARSMGFREKPDYAEWRKKFRETLKGNNHKNDGKFDWMRTSLKKKTANMYKVDILSAEEEEAEST